MWRVLTTFGPKMSQRQQQRQPPLQNQLIAEISSIEPAEPKIVPPPNIAAHWPRTSTLKSNGGQQLPTESKIFETALNDEYKVIRHLGNGGFGEAYYARRRKPGAGKAMAVVLKMMRASDRHQQRRLLFARREAEIMAALYHPHIVRFYHMFEEAGQVVIEMEYCDGGDLRQFLRNRNGALLPERQVRHWFHQLAQAVSFIHDRNIIHRDIKSKNVFLCENGRSLKLGDFGSAKSLIDRRSNDICLARTRVGTSSHHPPEFCRKQRREYGTEVDAWALGVLLFEMATLRMPFEAKTQQELSAKILCGVRDSEISPGLYSHSLRRLVDVLLARDPEDRPSIREVLDDRYFVTYSRFLRRLKRRRSKGVDGGYCQSGGSSQASSIRNKMRQIEQQQHHYYFDKNNYKNNPNYQLIESCDFADCNLGSGQTTSGVASGSASCGNVSPCPPVVSQNQYSIPFATSRQNRNPRTTTSV